MVEVVGVVEAGVGGLGGAESRRDRGTRGASAEIQGGGDLATLKSMRFGDSAGYGGPGGASGDSETQRFTQMVDRRPLPKLGI